MRPTDLPSVWRAHAQQIRSYAGDAAAAFERAAEELSTALKAWDQEELTLQQASQESGYHQDALARMVKEGRIPNAGKKGAPKILRRHLPIKPGKVVQPTPTLHLDGRNRDAMQRRRAAR